MNEIKIRITKKDIDKSDPAKVRAQTPLDRAVARDYPEYYASCYDGALRLQAHGDDSALSEWRRRYSWSNRDKDLVYPYDDTLSKFMAAWRRGANVLPITTTLHLNTYVTMVAEAGNAPAKKDNGARSSHGDTRGSRTNRDPGPVRRGDAATVDAGSNRHPLVCAGVREDRSMARRQVRDD